MLATGGTTDETVRLIFHEPYEGTDGFTRLGIKEKNNAETIIRELMQNSTDEGATEVNVRLVRTPLNQLPGIDTYVQAFELAVQSREADGIDRSDDEWQIIERIQTILASGAVNVLWWLDNGRGATPAQLDKGLLSQGNTTKGSNDVNSRGSYGLGHLNPFAASEMHYLLYVTRQPGHLTASGEVVLAAHNSPSGECVRSPRGILAKRVQRKNLQSVPDFGEVHPYLTQHITSPRGFSVGIVGFTDFDDGMSDPFRTVVAKHFLPLIQSNSLTLSYRDETSGEGVDLDSATLESVLSLVKDGQPKNSRKGILLSGRAAWEAYQAGQAEPDYYVEGVGRLRVLVDPPGIRKTAVHVYRLGMWITDLCPGLRASDFEDQIPFSAVVYVEEEAFAKLVRKAEGPEHQSIDLVSLKKAGKDEKFHRYVNLIAQRLREVVPERANEPDWSPPDFAAYSLPQFVQKRRRPSPGLPRGESRTTGDRSTSKRRGKARRTSDRPERTAAPAPGRPISTAVVSRALVGEDGRYSRIRAEVASEGHGAPFAVRVRLMSGSDGSCETPLADQYGAVGRITGEDGYTYAGGDPRAGTPLPALGKGRVILDIELLTPLEDSLGVCVDTLTVRDDMKPTRIDSSS